MAKLNKTPGHEPSGLAGRMPTAPGSQVGDITPKPRERDDPSGLRGRMPVPSSSRCEPPQRVTAAEDHISGVPRGEERWTKERVAAQFGHQRPSKLRAPDVSDLPDAMNSHIPAPPAQRLPSPVKDPTRSF